MSHSVSKSRGYATAGCENRTARSLFVRKTTPRPSGTLRTVIYSVTDIIYLLFRTFNSFEKNYSFW